MGSSVATGVSPTAFNVETARSAWPRTCSGRCARLSPRMACSTAAWTAVPRSAPANAPARSLARSTEFVEVFPVVGCEGCCACDEFW